ncbi:eukaryotic translation initiation factor 3 subunit C [Trifolium medium]|uniref:Eukaryotic translation initiation factor 3 subunit C n=1 Tax=Trifolium medium TaxID=97028 RepID=A0A392QRL3_9FABA|nr:eukaryotic translation initiation factor 3 subunit C [Trifolium medium]
MRIQRSNEPLVQPRLCWERPMVGWLKCNVDAGYYLNENTATSTCCFRDNEGQFILAQTSWKLAKLSVTEGEGMALIEAIKLAARAGNKSSQNRLSSNRFSSKLSSNLIRTFFSSSLTRLKLTTIQFTSLGLLVYNSN